MPLKPLIACNCDQLAEAPKNFPHTNKKKERHCLPGNNNACFGVHIVQPELRMPSIKRQKRKASYFCQFFSYSFLLRFSLCSSCGDVRHKRAAAWGRLDTEQDERSNHVALSRFEGHF